LPYGLNILFSIVKESKIQDGKHQLNFENFDVSVQMDQNERNILYTIKIRKVNCIGHTLRTNCLLPRVIEGKVEGRTDVTGRREGRRAAT
jgi:hypothetical protein